MKKILIITPVFNELLVLNEFINAIDHLKHSLLHSYDLKLLIIDDGSNDGSSELIYKLSAVKPWISYITLATNYGHQAALITGLRNSGNWADAVITMDVDLEHPPELIPKILDDWINKKVFLVCTIREDSKFLSRNKRFFSKLYYLVTRIITGIKLNNGEADFRLWDIRLLKEVHPFLEDIGSLRVFVAWLPVKKSYLRYFQNFQNKRPSKFTFQKNLSFFLIGLIKFSSIPFAIMLYLSLFGIIFTVIYSLYIGYYFFYNNIQSGWTSIILTVLIMGFMQIFSTAVLALYLKKFIFSRNLPRFIIASRNLSNIGD